MSELESNSTPVHDEGDGDPGRDWMLALQRGDSAAFDAIVLHYERPVRRFIARYLSDEHRADDLSQEAFLRVYRARARYEPTARFRTWLFTIVSRLCLNEIRGQARRRRLFSLFSSWNSRDDGAGGRDRILESVGDDHVEGPPERMEREELERVLLAAIGRLPEKQRAAILLVRQGQISYQDIADAIGVSVMAVKSLINRARESLRQTLESYREGWSGADDRSRKPRADGAQDA